MPGYRRKGVGAWQDLTKGAEPMLGVAMKTYIRDVDTKKKRERRCWQTGYMPTVSLGGSPEEEEAHWAVVWMKFQWGKLMRAYSTEVMWEVIQCTGVGLWSEGSWGNMNWVRVRNIKWEDGTHVLRARRRMKRKLTKWRISTIVCRSSTYKFVGVWEISRS